MEQLIVNDLINSEPEIYLRRMWHDDGSAVPAARRPPGVLQCLLLEGAPAGDAGVV